MNAKERFTLCFTADETLRKAADLINAQEINIYDNEGISWRDVTIFKKAYISRLFDMVDYDKLDDVADAICSALDGEYALHSPYDSFCVESQIYGESDAIPPKFSEFDYDFDYKKEILELKNLIKRPKQKAAEYAKKIATNRVEREIPQNSNNEQESQCYTKYNFTTAEVIHLVHHAGLVASGSNASDWAAVLHMLTGCSINTLRTKFNRQDNLTEGKKVQVEKKYKEVLSQMKKQK